MTKHAIKGMLFGLLNEIVPSVHCLFVFSFFSASVCVFRNMVLVLFFFQMPSVSTPCRPTVLPHVADEVHIVVAAQLS